MGLLIGLFGCHQAQGGGVAGLQLILRDIQRGLGGIVRRRRRFQAICILLQRCQSVGDILERGQHGAAILRGGLIVSAPGSALLIEQGAALEDRRRQSCADAPEIRARREQIAKGQRRISGGAAERDVGQAVGDGDSDPSAGGVQIGLRLQNIRTLRHQFGGQADRKIGGEGQIGQPQSAGRHLGGEAAGQDGELVVQLNLLLDQRRQGGCRGGQGGFLRGVIGAAGIALVQLVLQNLQCLGFGGHHLPRRVNLFAHGGFLDRGGHHIVDQGGVGGEHCIMRRLRLSIGRFHRAPGQAEDIGHERDRELRREKIVEAGIVRRGGRQRARRRQLPCGVEAEANLRQERAARRQGAIVRRTQGGVGGFQIGIVLQRQRHQIVDRRGMECRPPFAGNIGGLNKALGIAAQDIGGGGWRGEGLGGVAADIGRGRLFEVGSYRATGKQQQCKRCTDTLQMH